MSSKQHVFYADEKGTLDLVPGTLRGYRCWRWEQFSGRLMSTGWVHLWTPQPEQAPADCMKKIVKTFDGVEFAHVSPAPNRYCSCGYYASYDPWSYKSQVGMDCNYCYIQGTVSAHGRIVLGTGGFRAERITIDALFGDTHDGHTQDAADRYGVPRFLTKEQCLEKFPPSNVEELLRTRTP